MITSFQKLTEELEPKELNLMWECLYQEISDSLALGSCLHLSRLLSLLISSLQVNSGRGILGELIMVFIYWLLSFICLMILFLSFFYPLLPILIVIMLCRLSTNG